MTAAASAGARVEKPHEAHAWILLFLGSAFLVVYGAIALAIVALTGEAFSGRSWDEFVAFAPGMAPFFVNAGTGISGMGILGMMISAFGFRRGERWTWWALWYLPAFGVAGEVTDLILLQGHAYSFVLVAILSGLGLVLSFRGFFPRKT